MTVTGNAMAAADVEPHMTSGCRANVPLTDTELACLEQAQHTTLGEPTVPHLLAARAQAALEASDSLEALLRALLDHGTRGRREVLQAAQICRERVRRAAAALDRAAPRPPPVDRGFAALRFVK